MEAQTFFGFRQSVSIQDQEPWGKAFSYSALAHATIAFFFFTLTLGQKPVMHTILTDVNFLEQPLPPAPETAISGSPGAEGNAQLGAPGKAEPVASHPELSNKVEYSNPTGSPDGNIVTNQPMSGPIIAMGEIGLVGKKKGALVPLVGQTEGRKTKELLNVPTGGDGRGKDSPIALATENIGEIRKKDSALGAPLIHSKVVEGSLPDHMKKLAMNTLGDSRAKDLKMEKLKTNPLDDEKWGKSSGPFSMEGPLKYRKIKKIILPSYPRWAEEQGLEAAVSIRLWVDPSGKVKDSIYLERASGYTELDNLAKEAIKQFLFISLPQEATQEDEWGVATFRFELKK